jgi:hypothetical protein
MFTRMTLGVSLMLVLGIHSTGVRADSALRGAATVNSTSVQYGTTRGRSQEHNWINSPKWCKDGSRPSGVYYKHPYKPVKHVNNCWRWRLYGCGTLGWFTGYPVTGYVYYSAVYPGVDLIYYGGPVPRMDFMVAPGADPGKVVFQFDGMDGYSLDSEGDLILRTQSGPIIQKRPYIYQQIDGIQKPVAGHWVMRTNGRIGIEVDSYDKSFPLIISRR